MLSMSESQSLELLCVVEDAFTVTGRGTVIMPGRWQTGEVQSGDWIEIRSAQGGSHMARVSSVEITCSAPKYKKIANADNPAPFLLSHIDRENVHKGDEGWSVINPPVNAMTVAVKPVPPQKHSWWQRLKSRINRA